MILKGQKDRVERKVTVKKRVDNDKTVNVEFYMICKTAKVSEQVELDKKLRAEGVSDLDLVREWSDGWKGLTDAEDKPVEYNDENLEAVMDDRDYREAIVRTIFEAVFGKNLEFKVKN